jgi:hypothetical protein
MPASQAGRRRFEPGRPLWMWLRMNHLRKWPAGLGRPFLHSERSSTVPKFSANGDRCHESIRISIRNCARPGFRDCSSGLADRGRLGKANCVGWPSTADARQARGAAIAVQRVVERLSEGCERSRRRLGALRCAMSCAIRDFARSRPSIVPNGLWKLRELANAESE